MRYLHWEDLCLESLPSNFCVEQLVEFHMPHNKLTKLWDGIQVLHTTSFCSIYKDKRESPVVLPHVNLMIMNLTISDLFMHISCYRIL